MSVLLDTNVILRLFDISDPEQTDKAISLFNEGATGQVSLAVSPPVLFELVWVLRGKLGRSNEETLDIVESVITWNGLEVLDKETVVPAVHLARTTGRDFADAYITITAKLHKMQVATFNKKHFEKLGADMYPM